MSRRFVAHSALFLGLILVNKTTDAVERSRDSPEIAQPCSVGARETWDARWERRAECGIQDDEAPIPHVIPAPVTVAAGSRESLEVSVRLRRGTPDAHARIALVQSLMAWFGSVGIEQDFGR